MSELRFKGAQWSVEEILGLDEALVFDEDKSVPTRHVDSHKGKVIGNKDEFHKDGKKKKNKRRMK